MAVESSHSLVQRAIAEVWNKVRLTRPWLAYRRWRRTQARARR